MNQIPTVLREHDDGLMGALLENSFDSLMVTEAGERNSIIWVNRAFTELTGYSAAEVLGKSPSFLQGPATDAAVLQKLREAMATRKVFEGKATNYRKSGSAFTMWWRVVPVIASSGQVRYFVAFQREQGPL